MRRIIMHAGYGNEPKWPMGAKMKYALGALLILLSDFGANAQSLTATAAELHRNCNVQYGSGTSMAEIGENIARYTICRAYIDGVAHGFFYGVAVASEQNLKWCPPNKGVFGEKATAIFERYAREHPEKLDVPASVAVIAAMILAFPCNGSIK